MKKLFLGAALAVSSLTFAQQFGAKAGVNVASMRGDDGSGSTTGFYAGVFMNAPIAKDFSIQPEVLYNRLGGKTEAGKNGYDVKFKTNLDYISVPVMFQYNFVPDFYVEAGPQFSFLVSSKQKVETTINDNSAIRDYTDNYNKFDFGLGIGLGYNFTNNIGINARYVAGLTDLDKAEVSNIKNGAFQAGLNFKF